MAPGVDGRRRQMAVGSRGMPQVCGADGAGCHAKVGAHQSKCTQWYIGAGACKGTTQVGRSRQ